MKQMVLVAILGVLTSTGSLAQEKKLWANSFVNKKAPKFEVEKWLSVAPDCKGKFVLIDFWATWCGPCRKAIPELNAFHKKFGDKLVVIGLSDEPEAKVKAMTNPKIEYFSAIDTQKRMKSAVGVRGIPHVLILDPQGVVRWEGFPFLDGYELSEKVIQDILAKPTQAQTAENPEKDIRPRTLSEALADPVRSRRPVPN
jgi:thiol-disulfide isomerase/thioredoxin